MKRKENTACVSLFYHWRKDCERNNAVVVKPQEQRRCDLALACNCKVFELDTLIVINGYKWR